jgi:hypothetical protein
MPDKQPAKKAQGRGQERRRGERPLLSPPSGLHHIQEEAMGSMVPGDVIFLGEAESLRSAVESIFFAVLACPACGALGLITSAQYGGLMPVACGSSQCSCRFRIDEEGRFVFLPVN